MSTDTTPQTETRKQRVLIARYRDNDGNRWEERFNFSEDLSAADFYQSMQPIDDAVPAFMVIANGDRNVIMLPTVYLTALETTHE